MATKLLFADIVDLFASKTGQTKKDAETFLREFLALVSSKMKEHDVVKLKDFGVFKVVEVGSRESVDVNTGENIVIAAYKKISFTPDKILRELVNKPFASFEPELLNEGVVFEQADDVVDVRDNKETEIIVEDEFKTDSDEDVNQVPIASVPPLETQGGLPEVATDNSKEETTFLLNVESQSKENVFLDDASINVEGVKEEVCPIEVPIEDELANDLRTDLIKSSVKEFSKLDTDIDEDAQNEHKSKRVWLLLAACLFFFMCALYFYHENFQGREYVSSLEKMLVNDSGDDEMTHAKKTENLRTPHVSAVVDSVQEDSSADKKMKLPDHVYKKEPVVENKSTEHAPKVKKSTSFKAVLVSKGSTFRLLALKYYGSKEFWAYIYQANKDKFPNPNNLPSEVWVTIPDAKELGIDVSNPVSIRRAKALGEKVIRETTK